MSAINTVVHRPKLSTIIAISVGIVLSIPALFGTFYLFQANFTQATNTMPRDVIITEITTTSAKVSWTTDQEVQSVIEYGTSPSALVFYAPETKKTKDHHVELDLLTPKTTHYFQIRVEEERFDNVGSPWTFITKSTGTDKEPSKQPILPTQGLAGSQQTVIPLTSRVPTVMVNSCVETDCRRIQQKFGKGCNITDYIKCLNTSTTGPTATPSASLTSSPTSTTPTVTPTSVPKADLIITSVDNLCLATTGSNAKVQFKLTVKNQGTVTSGDHKLQIDFDSTTATDVNEYHRDVTAPIEPNASFTIEGEGTMTSCTKCTNDHDAKLTIDFDGDITEINEGNNTYFKSISCN